MKIRFWAADLGGCAYYRMHEPARVLRLLGHDAQASTILTESDCRDLDVLVGQRVCQPGASEKWRQLAEQRTLTGRPKLIYDLDDDITCLPETSVEARQFYNDPAVQDRIRQNISLANLLTGATPKIAESYASHALRYQVIPNGLPAELLQWDRPHHPMFTIGWVGSAQSKPELRIIADQVRRMLRRNPTWRFHAIGVERDTLADAGLDLIRVANTPWIQGTDRYLRQVDFDLWLAPYQDTPFNQAKYPTKALEAGFLGIPLIASEVGYYRDAILPGGTGFLANQHQPHLWSSAVWELHRHPELRDRIGQRARQDAALHTSEGYGAEWLEVFQ